ncbi:YtxH domain-containing protein [Vibrio tubiashii]|uniref:YtxH domain-containing protein n=1 Tax=Vibrio tubiashii TaxID=29498 RepID=UPI001EFE277F|nr:YtxH domain-containing protein [Vibrio tubiashii]MCG9582347.1 YtxH domain-containing protein [Vibrio tubiashii]MCG9615938.1 YtxH domain-containing protein [Vibrio tubiashii]MCG9689027.1 YtxH domain-containing protein [Vibrio tubiashii]
MNNNYPYGYPYYVAQPQTNPQAEQQQVQPEYKQQNSKTHFVMGVAAGAAVAYLLTNKKFKQGVASTGEKAWSAVRGEVEELKERLEDTQAELEYYRNLHKGEE